MNPGQRVRMKHSGPSTDRQIFTFMGVTAHDAQTATLLREDGKTISVDVSSIEPIPKANWVMIPGYSVESGCAFTVESGPYKTR